eukprot:1520958-Rhodomonas_salina.1
MLSCCHTASFGTDVAYRDGASRDICTASHAAPWSACQVLALCRACCAVPVAADVAPGSKCLGGATRLRARSRAQNSVTEAAWSLNASGNRPGSGLEWGSSSSGSASAADGSPCNLAIPRPESRAELDCARPHCAMPRAVRGSAAGCNGALTILAAGCN